MHIIVLNYEFPPVGGGAANACFFILREFMRFPDLRVTLLTSSIGAARTEQFAPNIEIRYLNVGGLKNLRYQPLSKLLRFAWASFWEHRKLERDADLIHAFFGIPSGFTAMFGSLPFVVSLRGSDVPLFNPRFYWLDRLLFRGLSRRIWRKSECTVANSEGLRQLALKSANTQAIGVIPNGVDTAYFRPCEKLATSEMLRIVSVGRLIPRKGFDRLIRATQGLPNVQLQIAGGGVLADELGILAQKLGVNLHLWGQLDRDALRDCLAEADVFVLASSNEGMSNAVLEAMASGLPLILSDVGGTSELIADNGFVVPSDSIEALREKIEIYRRDADLRRMHG
ncbi:MAG: hypothetical protein RIS47_673, partial [Bacteroidota bacterium]